MVKGEINLSQGTGSIKIAERWSGALPFGTFSGGLDFSLSEYHRHSVASSKSERIIPLLIEYIQSQGLKSGDKLPNEKQLSEVLGVRSASLREAMVILKTIGVLEPLHGSGWYIGTFDPLKTIRLMAPLLAEFTTPNFEQYIDVRLINEPVAARLAANHITPKGLEDLHASLTGMQQAKESGSPPEYRRCDWLFHEIIARESGNESLFMMCSMMIGIYFSLRWWDPNVNEKFAALDYHARIIQAIESHQADSAENLMREHLTVGRQKHNETPL